MMFLTLIFVLVCFLFKLLHPGQCFREKIDFYRYEQKYLANHVKYKHVIQTNDELDCAMHCVTHWWCASVNYKVSGLGKGRCEPNDKALHEVSDSDEKTKPEFNHLYIIKKVYGLCELNDKALPEEYVEYEETKPESSHLNIITQEPQSSLSTCSELVIANNEIHSFEAPATCTVIQHESSTSKPSGIYNINPQRRPNESFPVYCDMTSENGIGVTVIGHDSENRTKMKNSEVPGSYSRTIEYNISMEQTVAIINQSGKCKQFIKYECFDSRLLNNTNDTQYGWWISRNGENMTYWGGAKPGSNCCACGMTNSCAKRDKKCNDTNDPQLREDSCYLTDKNTLPVTELRFRDTGSSGEYGYHTLGKLRCWG